MTTLLSPAATAGNVSVADDTAVDVTKVDIDLDSAATRTTKPSSWAKRFLGSVIECTGFCLQKCGQIMAGVGSLGLLIEEPLEGLLDGLGNSSIDYSATVSGNTHVTGGVNISSAGYGNQSFSLSESYGNQYTTTGTTEPQAIGVPAKIISAGLFTGGIGLICAGTFVKKYGGTLVVRNETEDHATSKDRISQRNKAKICGAVSVITGVGSKVLALYGTSLFSFLRAQSAVESLIPKDFTKDRHISVNENFAFPFSGDDKGISIHGNAEGKFTANLNASATISFANIRDGVAKAVSANNDRYTPVAYGAACGALVLGVMSVQSGRMAKRFANADRRAKEREADGYGTELAIVSQPGASVRGFRQRVSSANLSASV